MTDQQQVQELHRLLKYHYGYDCFRPLQLDAIQGTLASRDVLLLLPTGGGKSLTFQLPPLYISKIAVIITPLLALAKDQVEAANDKYSIEASSWSSETPEPRKKSIANELLGGMDMPMDMGNELGIDDDPTLRLLYITPEALQTERLRTLLISAHHLNRLCSLVVDEAHCCRYVD